MRHKVLFLTLRVFSATGGIEKVCRVAGKALYEMGVQQDWKTAVFSMHGSKNDADLNSYFPQELFAGFNGKKIRFLLSALQYGRRAEVILLSHINLLLIGWLVKLVNPSAKLIMLAHGIEVWDALPRWKRMMLKSCDRILPVSKFTRDKMLAVHGLPAEKFQVLNNCLDPFLEKPLKPDRDPALLERYGLEPDQKILLTVARLSDTELYKGYDRVLMALPALTADRPSLKYMLVGSYGKREKLRLDSLILTLGLQENVLFTGFVPDEELGSHFNLADIFVMPSEKEGFGIVFIEAMFYGKPVIAGNRDGSVDALRYGEMGLLVDPKNVEEIGAAIKKMLDDPAAYLPDAEKLQAFFGYSTYKKNLGAILEVTGKKHLN